MNTPLKSRIELILNVVITVAIVIVAAMTVKRYLSPHAGHEHDQGNRQAPSLVGTVMNVPGAELRPGEKSLVLFLMKDCPACKMVAPLYRELLAEASKRGIKRVAILPDTLEEATQYLRSLDLDADQVLSGNLSSYNISSVPTALILDANGVVKGFWRGAAPGRDNEIRTQVVALLGAKGP